MSALTHEVASDVVIASISYVLEIPPAAVAINARLAADLGADSLAIVQIADVLERSLLDRSLSIVIDDADLAGIDTVSAAVDYLVARS